MKKLLLSLSALSFLFAVSAANALEYGFDKAHSHVGFTVKHILSKVSGEFKEYDGTFTFDAAKPEASKVNVTIQASSINTDNEMRDHHLQTPDFFDVEKFPTLTFKSTKVEKGAVENKYKVTGNLTMHGVTKSVVLDVDYLGADTMQMGKDGPTAKVAGFSATTSIDRRDYGLAWGQDKLTAAGNLMVANDVTINIDVAGIDKKSAEAMKKMGGKKKPADKK